MRVGICGYPGSGKSTVFCALAPGGSSSRGGVAYGNIKVPDERVDTLAGIFSPKRKVYAEITFVDVGGQPGRSAGAFPPAVLQHMRNADVLVHVVRAFENPMLSESADVERDNSRFGDELVLLDLAILEKRGERFGKENRKGAEVEVNARCVEHLENGEPLRTLGLSDAQLETMTGIQLLSLTPVITLYNLSEDDWEDSPLRALNEAGSKGLSLGICGALEAEIATMDEDDQTMFLEELGMSEPARNAFIKAAFGLLDLISFLTAGPDECRAWPIPRGSVAKKAAGKVHSDIERGFIRAEIYCLPDLLEHGSEAALKAKGLIRREGKEYVVQDGDVVNYLFNV